MSDYPQQFIFHPRLFNPLYWHIRKYLNDPNIRYIFVYGGSSAAKTYSLVQTFCVEQLTDHFNLAVFRKESTTIDDTVYGDFKNVSERLQMDGVHRFIEKEMRLMGGKAFVKFKGLDDGEKIKGLSMYQYVYLNELSKFNEEDFNEAARRLRGRPGQKIIADWNPISEDHWIKKKIIDLQQWKNLPLYVSDAPTKYSSLESEYSSVQINEKGNTILICTTYRDNYFVVGHPSGKGGFIDKHALDEFERMQIANYDDYLVYANGKWGTIRTGTEFFDNFSRQQHVKSITPDVNASVTLAFDFNNLPYSTCLLRQITREEDTIVIRYFDEICLSPPTNTIEDIRDDMEYRYPWIKGLFYVMDPSGKSNTQRKSRMESLSYSDEIEKTFAKYLHNLSDRSPRYHPPKAKRRTAVKKLLSGLYKVRIEIDPKCKNLIGDLERLQIDTDGGYIKKRVTEKRTGQTYEERGHCADAMIYDLSSEFPESFF